MNIGELSELLGMSASAIRYYERVGLLERQSRVAGRRIFGESSIRTLRFIQLAKSAGFTVAEIKSLGEDYVQDPNYSGLWRDFAESKRTSVRAQIAGLEKMDKILSRLMECSCPTLNHCVEAYVETSVRR